MATLEAAVQSSHEAVDRQMTSLGTDMRCVSDRVDKHETRLTVQEKAWEEQVKPAIARLDEVRMAVARSAWLSGGIVGAVVLGAEILAKFTGLW